MRTEDAVIYDYWRDSVTVRPAARWQVIREKSQVDWLRRVCGYFSQYSTIVLDLRGVSVMPASKRALWRWLAGCDGVSVIGLGAILRR